MAKAPSNCVTMAEVRAGVDALDRELVRLLVVRQGYMDAAARIKPRRDQVRDAARVEAVVANVLAEARAQGLAKETAEPVWRELIERCIGYELEAWDTRRVVVE